MRWTESRPASPMRPSPRPMVGNCWQGDPATTSRTPPHGTLSTTFRSLAPRWANRCQTFAAARLTRSLSAARLSRPQQRSTACASPLSISTLQAACSRWRSRCRRRRSSTAWKEHAHAVKQGEHDQLLPVV
eukprot:10937226-Alexandrium_andersonii.AAC.1